MEKPVLILISGQAASGKSTLGKIIAQEFKLPLVGADAIKEKMWDSIGWEHDVAEWDKIGQASFELMYYFVEACLSKGKSVIAEAHFDPGRNNARLDALKEKYGCQLLQVHCRADKKVIEARFRQRLASDSFHPGHRHGIDQLYGKDKFFDKVGTGDKLLTIEGETLEIDTTDPEKIVYAYLFEWIKDVTKDSGFQA